MFICENFNLTVGIYSASYEELLYIKDNSIHGLIGKYQQKLIESRKSKPFNCKLILEDDIGGRLKNGSYTGALKLIQQKEMDFFLRHLSGYVDTDSIDLTPVINSEKYIIVQMFDDEPILNERCFFFSLFDLKYTIFILLNLLIFFSIISLISICLNKRKKILFILNSIIKFQFKNQIKWLTILSITYLIFIFVTKQIYLINIKTSKVVMDTSFILSDETRIFESNLKVIWIKGERENYLSSTAPNGTFLFNLWSNKNYNPPIVLDKNDLSTGLNIIKNAFLFLTENAARAGAYYLNKYLNIKIFINEKPFFHTTNFIYRIKESNIKTKFIDDSIKKIFEHGIFIKYINDLSNLNLLRTKDKNPIYSSIDEIVNDYTIFEKITFNNLFYLFVIYFIFNILILITFNLFKFKNFIIKLVNYLLFNLIKIYKILKRIIFLDLITCKRQ